MITDRLPTSLLDVPEVRKAIVEIPSLIKAYMSEGTEIAKIQADARLRTAQWTSKWALITAFLILVIAVIPVTWLAATGKIW